MWNNYRSQRLLSDRGVVEHPGETPRMARKILYLGAVQPAKIRGDRITTERSKDSHRPTLIGCLRKRIIRIIIQPDPTPGAITAGLTQHRAETGTKAQILAKNITDPAAGIITDRDHIQMDARGQEMAQDKTRSNV